MMRTLLVANRTEVASRVFRTARQLGLRTVAVYSEADAELPFVSEADEAVCIGPAGTNESYLSISKILEAAERTGADAIHPGYGFLSERADFAAAVVEAGLTWVGPSAEGIRAMGDKSAARQLAIEQGIPVVEGYHGADQSDSTFAEQAARIGYPVLLKASAGGGGRGIRLVSAPHELNSAMDSARREAKAAFGDGRLLMERWIPRPRHIEVQVFGDGKGNVLHLFERECSIQRRHQKIVEEAPAPNLDSRVRQALLEAAVRIAKAVNYAGAGTVEFIAGQDGSWAFLEMNTRLQVEHEVTECVTGVDLVAWQLFVADGEGLPLQQSEIQVSGSAIEVRLYAEDPNRDWLPTFGEIVRFDVQADRVSASFRPGDTVSVHYDSLLTKLVFKGRSRAHVVRKLADALERAWVPGLTTNLPLLRQISRVPAFEEGHTPTVFLAEAGLPKPPPTNLKLSLLGAALWSSLRTRAADRSPKGVPVGFRLGEPAWQSERWQVGGDVHPVNQRWTGTNKVEVRIAEQITCIEVVEVVGDAVRLTVDGVQQTWRLAASAARVFVHSSRHEGFAVHLPRFPRPEPPPPEPGSCLAPTPGTVRAVRVKEGDTVEVGEVLVVVEAMKMEHAVRAPSAGRVSAVRCSVGASVEGGELLVKLEP